MNTVPRLLAALLVLAAAAPLLGACGGSSGRIDYAQWNHLYGDPDTGGSGLGSARCCRHATRSN